jgi:hypothetical protein
MSKDISDLRAALFEVIEGVRSGAIDIEKAKMVNELSKTIVESAKVEVEFLEVTGATESKFISPPAKEEGEPPATTGITGRTVHKLR